MRDLVAGLAFAALVAIGVTCMLLPRGDGGLAAPPKRVRAFVALGLGLSLAAGFSGRSLWPFASWHMIHMVLGSDVRVPALMCAATDGSGFDVDYRAWAPLTVEEMEAWFSGPYTRLPAALQDSARATLLRLAESARQRVRRGEPATSAPSVFGRWAASSHLLHPRRWNRPSDAPATACVALRMVERRWNVTEVASGRGTIHERTLWEYRPAP